MTDGRPNPEAHLPRAGHCDAIATNLETAARWIRDHGPAVLKATTTRDDPHNQTRTPRPNNRPDNLADLDGSNAPRSPTEQAALSSKWLHDHQLALRSLLSWTETNATDTVEAINQILRRVDPLLITDTPRTTAGLEAGDDCCEPNCEAPADRGWSSRCQPCGLWRHTWTTDHNGQPAPPVPSTVIADRLLLETNARVHVTGPNAITP